MDFPFWENKRARISKIFPVDLYSVFILFIPLLPTLCLGVTTYILYIHTSAISFTIYLLNSMKSKVILYCTKYYNFFIILKKKNDMQPYNENIWIQCLFSFQVDKSTFTMSKLTGTIWDLVLLSVSKFWVILLHWQHNFW